MATIDDLVAMVNDPAYTDFAELAASKRTEYIDNALFFSHLDSIAKVLPRFKQIVNESIPVPVTMSEEITPPEGNSNV